MNKGVSVSGRVWALTPSSQRSAGERRTVALPVEQPALVLFEFHRYIFLCILCLASAIYDMSFVCSSVIVGLDRIIVETLSSPQRSTHSLCCRGNTEVIYSLYLFLLLLFTFNCFCNFSRFFKKKFFPHIVWVSIKLLLCSNKKCNKTAWWYGAPEFIKNEYMCIQAYMYVYIGVFFLRAQDNHYLLLLLSVSVSNRLWCH